LRGGVQMLRRLGFSHHKRLRNGSNRWKYYDRSWRGRNHRNCKTREKVAIGVAELDRGEGVDGPTIMNQMLERFQKARESSELKLELSANKTLNWLKRLHREAFIGF
jgi:hypothetical protein